MLKSYLTIMIFFLISGYLSAQDIIYKYDKSEIHAKVIEITDETIKYKNFSQPNGPIRNVNLNEVFMIIYEDGTREVIQNKFVEPVIKYENTSSQQISTTNEARNTPQLPVDSYFAQNKNQYFSIAVGYGNSYGGLGTRIQSRWGGKIGFGVHAGIGVFPNEVNNIAVLYSAGIKFFWYKGAYINTQFGVFGVESYNSNSIYDESYLAGPSFLIGGDWFWGSPVGFGFNVGVGVSVNVNETYYYEEVWPAIDMGFMIKF